METLPKLVHEVYVLFFPPLLYPDIEAVITSYIDRVSIGHFSSKKKLFPLSLLDYEVSFVYHEEILEHLWESFKEADVSISENRYITEYLVEYQRVYQCPLSNWSQPDGKKWRCENFYVTQIPILKILACGIAKGSILDIQWTLDHFLPIYKAKFATFMQGLEPSEPICPRRIWDLFDPRIPFIKHFEHREFIFLPLKLFQSNWITLSEQEQLNTSRSLTGFFSKLVSDSQQKINWIAPFLYSFPFQKIESLLNHLLIYAQLHSNCILLFDTLLHHFYPTPSLIPKDKAVEYLTAALEDRNVPFLSYFLPLLAHHFTCLPIKRKTNVEFLLECPHLVKFFCDITGIKDLKRRSISKSEWDLSISEAVRWGFTERFEALEVNKRLSSLHIYTAFYGLHEYPLRSSLDRFTRVLEHLTEENRWLVLSDILFWSNMSSTKQEIFLIMCLKKLQHQVYSSQIYAKLRDCFPHLCQRFQLTSAAPRKEEL